MFTRRNSEEGLRLWACGNKRPAIIGQPRTRSCIGGFLNMPRAAVRRLLGFCCLLLVLLSGHPCLGENNPATTDIRSQYRRPGEIPFPDDNPYSEAKAALGRTLFFDPRLSGTGSHACSTCHLPWISWGDGLPRAIGWGGKPLPLRSPTLLNVAWLSRFGWDGKFEDLESVAFTALLAPANMRQTEPDLVAKLRRTPDYVVRFRAAFGSDGINRRAIELALATFQRTIVSGQAPFDRWIEGDDQAIPEAAKRGFDLFNGKANCAECHTGWNFTEGAFYDIGLAKDAEIGRGGAFPKSVKLKHAFKVPTLRDVARRAPYMHDGSLADLDAVIAFYDSGGRDRPSRSDLIRPLGLTEREKADLRAFMETLTEVPGAFQVPVLPR